MSPHGNDPCGYLLANIPPHRRDGDKMPAIAAALQSGETPGPITRLLTWAWEEINWLRTELGIMAPRCRHRLSGEGERGAFKVVPSCYGCQAEIQAWHVVPNGGIYGQCHKCHFDWPLGQIQWLPKTEAPSAGES